jgi:hypothetical protein
MTRAAVYEYAPWKGSVVNNQLRTGEGCARRRSREALERNRGKGYGCPRSLKNRTGGGGWNHAASPTS